MDKKPYVSHDTLVERLSRQTKMCDMWQRLYKEALEWTDDLQEEVTALKEKSLGDEIENLKKELNVR